MNHRAKSYFFLHIAVFLYGFTGILGQVINLSAMHLIFWRCLLSSIMLAPFLFFKKDSRLFNPKSILIFSGIGVLLGLHWLCFYGSIKLANSSVAMICLSVISVMTVFFEALFSSKKIVKQDLIIGLMVIPGIFLINQSLSPDFKIGFWIGILCSVFSAIVASLNKKYLHLLNATGISWIEITIVCILFSLLSLFNFYLDPASKFLPSVSDWIYLAILSVFCTVIPWVLVIKSMNSLSAFSTMLVFNLETVYGIILSIVLLKEHKQLNILFYLGVFIILASVFVYPLIKKKQ